MKKCGHGNSPPSHGNRYPLAQILTVEEVLKGHKAHRPFIDSNLGYGKKAGLADIQGKPL